MINGLFAFFTAWGFMTAVVFPILTRIGVLEWHHEKRKRNAGATIDQLRSENKQLIQRETHLTSVLEYAIRKSDIVLQAQSDCPDFQRELKEFSLMLKRGLVALPPISLLATTWGADKPKPPEPKPAEHPPSHYW